MFKTHFKRLSKIERKSKQLLVKNTNLKDKKCLLNLEAIEICV